MIRELKAKIEGLIHDRAQRSVEGVVLSSDRLRQARADQFNTVIRQYRTAPLMMSVFAISLVFFLDSAYPSFVPIFWASAVILAYGVMVLVQESYFRSPDVKNNPDRWIKLYALAYWICNIVWVCLLPIFWAPDNPTQEMFLFMILICHVVTVTAISFRNLPVLYATSGPAIIMATLGAFSNGEQVYFVLGILIAGLFAFLMWIAHSAHKQSLENFSVRFRNEELIEDLAHAIEASNATRARAEEANLNLREREELFRALVENAYDTILLTDDQGLVRYAAPSIKQFGMSADKAIGRSINEILASANDENTNTLYNAIKQEKSHGHVQKLKDHVKTSDGRDAWIEASVTDLRGSASVGGLVLNIRDVTTRQRADDEMHQHLEVLDSLATGASLDVILKKITTSVDHTNTGAYSAIFLVDDTSRVVRTTSSNVPTQLLESIEGMILSPTDGCCGAAIARGERVIVSDVSSDPLEQDYLGLLGNLGFSSCWAQPIFSRGGRILGTLTTFYKEQRAPTNIEIAFVSGSAYLAGIAIDRRQQENQLREASENAEMANRSKSRFLATMSHELRTPLNAIIGFSEVMQQEMFGKLGNDRYREYMTDILNSGRHLLSMIDDILDLSKIEAGRYDLEERDMDIGEAISWSAELIRPKASAGGLELILDTNPDLPLVYADRRTIRQILLNLLSNAVKFTNPGGTVTITTEVNERTGLTIAVTDTGIGIPADKIAEALEPFVQVESELTGKNHGTGLGLSITKHLVEMHNGGFNLTSEEGVGTCVSFSLPPQRLITIPTASTSTAKS
ncbi:MAG: hypothetical protein COA62_09030 [Rhodobiaceae bacterium]|nr:MAG: hypothetical protein COA62_09030 [Rhodobiaceae bacterium]